MPPAKTYCSEASFGDIKRSISNHKSLDQDNTALIAVWPPSPLYRPRDTDFFPVWKRRWRRRSNLATYGTPASSSRHERNSRTNPTCALRRYRRRVFRRVSLEFVPFIYITILCLLPIPTLYCCCTWHGINSVLLDSLLKHWGTTD
jgi:hypothetical protein